MVLGAVGNLHVAIASANLVPFLGAALMAVTCAFEFSRWFRSRVRGGGPIEVHRDGLHANGRLALPLRTLRRAVVSRDDNGWVVSFERSRRAVAIVDVANAKEGRALVKALGLDPARAQSAFTFDAPLRRTMALWIALLLPTPFLALQFGVPLAAVCVCMLLASVYPTRLVVGLDGLLVHWLWRREFIRLGDVRAIHDNGSSLVLDLANGRRRALSVSRRDGEAARAATGFGSKGAYLDAVVGRIREAIAASRAGGSIPVALERRDQDLGTWINALRSVVRRGAADFRDAATSPDQLWRTVQNGGAPPIARAAAAIALGPTLDDADRERLLTVARVVVSPRLRVALEAAAGDDEPATLEAMAALEEANDDRRTKTRATR
jgi:hypothetical protein